MYSGNDTTRDVLAKEFEPNYAFAVSESDVAPVASLNQQSSVLGYSAMKSFLVVSSSDRH